MKTSPPANSPSMSFGRAASSSAVVLYFVSLTDGVN